jgi:hypothetical protein
MLPAFVFQLAAATQAAKSRTGDKTIGTRADNGRIDIVRVTYKQSGSSTVQVVQSGLTPDQAIAALGQL